jgi:hypothetical protein
MSTEELLKRTRKAIDHLVGLGIEDYIDLDKEIEAELAKHEQGRLISSGCQCNACKNGITHSSDCAVHNEPAYINGPCDCGSDEFAKPDTDPVGWIMSDSDFYRVGYDQRAGRVLWLKSLNDYPGGAKLYTSLPARQPLSVAQIECLLDSPLLNAFAVEVTRRVEKAHGIE